MIARVCAILFFVGFCIAAVPVTPQRFSSSFSQALSMSFGSFEGKRDSERLLRRFYGNEVTDLIVSRAEQQETFEIVATIKGTQKVDMASNILFQQVNSISIKSPGELISMDLLANQLFFYDLNQNYTWDATTCLCAPIEGSAQMPFYSLPPFATKVADGVSITINGQSVTTSHYTANFEIEYLQTTDGVSGRSESASEVEFSLYLDGSNNVRRVFYSVNAFFFLINTTIDMWNVQPLGASEVILPATSCKDKCTVEMPTLDDYPSTCGVPDFQCTCLETEPTFCDGVTYPVSTLINPDVSDNLASASYSATLQEMTKVGNVSQECKDGLKDFLCKFYFSFCNSTYNSLKPDISVFTCGSSETQQREAAFKTNGAFSSYLAADGQTQDQPLSPTTTTAGAASVTYSLLVLFVATISAVLLL